MRHAAPLLLLAASAAATSAIAASCKEPTQVVIEARTNVGHRAGMTTSFTVGSPGQTEKADPTTETREPWGPDGFIGSLVAVPGSADDAPLSVKIVLAIDRDVRDCTAANAYAGCIVARRRLRYAPSTRLRLPIALYASCIGVPCDESTTCSVLGTCVPAEVDSATCSSDEGCLVSGDDGIVPPNDGGLTDAPSDSDAGVSAIPDATTDVAVDAADAGADGGPSTPRMIDCRSVTCATTDGGHCCYDTATDQAACVPANAGCLVGGTYIDIRCDDDTDCSNGEVCCYSSAGESFQCMSASACSALGKKVCHVNPATCASCTAKIDGYYSYCQ